MRMSATQSDLIKGETFSYDTGRIAKNRDFSGLMVVSSDELALPELIGEQIGMLCRAQEYEATYPVFDNSAALWSLALRNAPASGPINIGGTGYPPSLDTKVQQ